MDQKKLPLLIIAVLLFVVVVLVVYFSKDSYHTEVFYADNVSEKDSGSSRKNSGSQKSSSTKKSSSSKKGSSSKSNSGNDDQDEMSWEESEEYLYLYSDSEKEYGEDTSESGWKPSPEESEEQENSLSFSDVQLSAENLEKQCGVKIYLHTVEEEQPVSASYFTSPEEAQKCLDILSGLLSLCDGNLLRGLSGRGMPLKITVVQDLPSQNEAVSFEGISGGISLYLQNGSYPEESFMKSLALGCYGVLEYQGKLNRLEEEIQKYNPERFSYGKYLPQYVLSSPENTYFLNTSSLLSMKNDVVEIYASYYADLVSDGYFQDACPISQKLQAILRIFQNELY